MNKPVPVTKETLLALLDDIRAHVEADDSWEGSIEYAFPWHKDMGDPEEDGPDVQFRVRAAYRVGNRNGQGGMRMVGDLT